MWRAASTFTRMSSIRKGNMGADVPRTQTKEPLQSDGQETRIGGVSSNLREHAHNTLRLQETGTGHWEEYVSLDEHNM